MNGHSRRKTASLRSRVAPAIHAGQHVSRRGGWVYIVTNRPNATLYIGVTSKLSLRLFTPACAAAQGARENVHNSGRRCSFCAD